LHPCRLINLQDLGVLHSFAFTSIVTGTMPYMKIKKPDLQIMKILEINEQTQ